MTPSGGAWEVGGFVLRKKCAQSVVHKLLQSTRYCTGSAPVMLGDGSKCQKIFWLYKGGDGYFSDLFFLKPGLGTRLIFPVPSTLFDSFSLSVSHLHSLSLALSLGRPQATAVYKVGYCTKNKNLNFGQVDICISVGKMSKIILSEIF